MSGKTSIPCKLLLLGLIIGSGYLVSPAQTRRSRSAPPQNATSTPPPAPGGNVTVTGQRIVMATGVTLLVDEVSTQGDEVWYRVGNVWKMLSGAVKAVEPVVAAAAPAPSPVAAAAKDQAAKPAPSYWIHLAGGARVKADSVTEDSSGAWYQRGNLSIFLERARIARIELESDTPTAAVRWKGDGWTSGNNLIDSLIRTNGERFGVDPYLIFLVIEHESHFRTRALSPKGAQGLMQLMPGTARRFGVRRPYDPAENIHGGTQYLKELLKMFGGQVHLALASYNAGEGAVMKYGRNIPPYRETREYVKRITKRYGSGNGTEP